MANIKYAILYILFIVSFCASAQNKLEIQITKLSNDKGVVCLDLLDSNNKLLVNKKTTISNKKCTFIIDNLKS